MQSTRRSLVVLLVGLAAVLTFPDRSVGGSISYNVSVDSETQSGFLPQLNPGFGLLQSVTYAGTISVGNEFGFQTPQSNASYQASTNLILINTDMQEATFGFGQTTGSVFLDPLTSGCDVTANINVSGSLDLPDYCYGTGCLNVQVAGDISVTNADPFFFPSSDGEITFTYTYGVPEPHGLILALISSALPICLLVRKRFAKRAV